MTGDPTRRDRLAWWLTWHVPLVRSLRARWATRKGRPGFRPSDW